MEESEREELARLRAEKQRLRKDNVELGMERDVLPMHGLVGEVADAEAAVLVGVIGNCKTENAIPHTVACRAFGVWTP
ncbi:hypothetical protein [Streptomyces sp. NPDC005533]|uniref:hypothetical protein n=1 Tax=Streptomyces sp. NPDC005533 TaxID=3364723 RepID=UPI00368293C9